MQSKKDGKDQESIQSSTTPDQGYHMPPPPFVWGDITRNMEFKDQHEVIKHSYEGQTKIQGAKQLYSDCFYPTPQSCLILISHSET